jgi:hypothetical protein
MRIDGRAYAENDVVALASDLETLVSRGFRFVPLHDLVRHWLAAPDAYSGQKVAALSCDDGGDFDFLDLPHPAAGPQRSVLNTLRDFHARHPATLPHITSFAIVSPEARTELDRTCMIGRGWWTDGWWRAAAASGYMHIANHSWDHNHEALPERFSHGVARGTFKTIATRELADAEIRVAQQFLRDRAPNPGNTLFAYPYGDFNDYLVEEYFPRYGEAMGIEAAFSDKAGYLTAGTNRWTIPRFVFGRDWKSPDELLRILDARN